MAKKSKKYWRQRSIQLQEALLNKGENYLHDLDQQYKIVSAEIQKDIDSWYRRFAKNNCLTLVDAKKLLTTTELKEFKWSVEEYIKYGEKNAINQRWMEELENASAKFHITRLESLKIQLQQKIEILYGNQSDGLDKLLRNIYTEGYYHTAFEIQKGFNTGFSLMSIDDNRLEKVLSKPWAEDGLNFSQRIWGDDATGLVGSKDKLINALYSELTNTFITGKPLDIAIKNISTKFNTSRKNASRLVMTESAFFAAEGQKDCFNTLGVKQYEIVATLDSRTSVGCQELDGKVFDMKDYEVGITAPPFHCHCRTCTCPYFDDEFTLGEGRAARNSKGKVYYIDSDIKYPEWEKRFVA